MSNLWNKIDYHVRNLLAEIDKAIPRLVWKNEELDVALVLFTDGTIVSDKPAEEVPFKTQALKEAADKLREAGITFNVGISLNAQTWMLDSSLCGPMRVKFIGRAKKPMRRLEW